MQQHREKLKDTLEACVLSIIKVPELAQRDLVLEVQQAGKALAARERLVESTDRVRG